MSAPRVSGAVLVGLAWCCACGGDVLVSGAAANVDAGGSTPVTRSSGTSRSSGTKPPTPSTGSSGSTGAGSRPATGSDKSVGFTDACTGRCVSTVSEDSGARPNDDATTVSVSTNTSVGPGPLLDSGLECVSPDDCTALLGNVGQEAVRCPDGTTGVDHYLCTYGVCHASYCGSQPMSLPDAGHECASPSDCTALLGPAVGSFCGGCPGGGDGCPEYVCLAGLCQTTYCGANPAAVLDGGIECATPNDCTNLLGPLPSECVGGCPGGGDGCQHYLCIAGLCQPTYCD